MVCHCVALGSMPLCFARLLLWNDQYLRMRDHLGTNNINVILPPRVVGNLKTGRGRCVSTSSTAGKRLNIYKRGIFRQHESLLLSPNTAYARSIRPRLIDSSDLHDASNRCSLVTGEPMTIKGPNCDGHDSTQFEYSRKILPLR